MRKPTAYKFHGKGKTNIALARHIQLHPALLDQGSVGFRHGIRLICRSKTTSHVAIGVVNRELFRVIINVEVVDTIVPK